jgi:hypothetical protein
MAGYMMRPIEEKDLSEVWAFRTKSMQLLLGTPGAADDGDHPSTGLDSAGWDPRWLLGEGNPARTDGIPPGEIIRDGNGAVMGMITYHPQYFRLGDKRVLGLGAGNFHVDPSARLQGFFLFKRYLNHPRADFCFATSCNDNSGALWAKCGAGQVPNSDTEYLYVRHAGPVLQEHALRTGLPRALALSARLAGPVLNLVMWARRRGSSLKVRRSTEWERLAELAEQNRDPACLTHERTVAVLQGKYETLANKGQIGGTADGMYHFTDAQGREGWFALQEARRGRLNQIGTITLLDVVWPRTRLDFADVLRALIGVASGRADMISIRDRACFGLRPGLCGFRARALPAPEAFIVSPGRSGLPPSAELARLADFSAAADRL